MDNVFIHLLMAFATYFHNLGQEPEVTWTAKDSLTGRQISELFYDLEVTRDLASPCPGAPGLLWATPCVSIHARSHPRLFLFRRFEFNVLERGSQLPFPRLVFRLSCLVCIAKFEKSGQCFKTCEI